MATTYDFSYTNTTGATNKVTPTNLQLVTNYAKVTDEPTMAVLSNKTASMEQPELITYKSRRQNKLDTNVKPINPAPVSSGVVYSARIDCICRVDDGAGHIVDEPCAAWINIAHPASNTWTNARVASVVARLIGALQGSDGASWRFEDLMKSALIPAAD